MEQMNSQTARIEQEGSRTPSLYQRIVLGLLSKMTEGHIILTLPSGESMDLGDPESPTRVSLRILDDAFFRKSVLYGDIGFAESYLDGDWETENLPLLLKVMLMNLQALPLSGAGKSFWKVNLMKGVNRLSHVMRGNTISGSRENISEHYDLSNEFYRIWLDPSMTYSSGVFSRDTMSLEEAQEEKYDRLCRQLQLKEGEHLLEIGTGWGGMAVHAARKYGVRVTTITISKEQHAYAVQRVRNEGLDHLVDVKFQDYRTLDGQYDKLVSIEMLEAVGHAYLETFFEVCQRVLKPHGLLAVQVITSPDSRYKEFRKNVDFIQKHIFPGSLLPSIDAMNRAVNKTGDMHLHHLEEFGLDYARTLGVWRRTFNASISRIKDLGFDDDFIRKWNYYLSYCEAGFAMRNISVVHMVYTRPNNTSLN